MFKFVLPPHQWSNQIGFLAGTMARHLAAAAGDESRDAILAQKRAMGHAAYDDEMIFFRIASAGRLPKDMYSTLITWFIVNWPEGVAWPERYGAEVPADLAVS